MNSTATVLATSLDPLVVNLRSNLRRATGRAQRRDAVLTALIDWADDGLRTGKQLDAILDAAREVLS